MGTVDKGTIDGLIVPHLSKGKRGFKPKIPLNEVVLAIFYRLKTGCQWRELPLKQFSGTVGMSWESVFNKRGKDGSWRSVWVALLRSKRSLLDLSSVQLDGGHTTAKRGGQAVGHQGRKASKTSNALFLAGNTGQMLALLEPQESRHHDLYKIKGLFTGLCGPLKEAGIDSWGVFLNVGPGFDSKELRSACTGEEIEANIKPNPRNTGKDNDEDHYFDEELYKRRTVIEHANAWMDGFKGLVIRYEVLARNWMAFSVFFLGRINKKTKV